MAYDLAFGRTTSNWARGQHVTTVAGENTRKLVHGGMALAVLGGLALVMSPWWRPLPKPRPAFEPRPRHLFKIQHFPGGRMIMRPL